MFRARRLASVAVIAALALTGLTACRSAPDVAAYVGKTRITEKRVDDVFKGVQTPQAATSGGQPSAAPTRQDVVDTLVGVGVMRELAQQKHVTATRIDPAQVAQSLGLNPQAEYVALFTEYRGLLNALSTGVKPAQPSQADLRDVYTRLTKGGANPSNASFAQFTGGIAQQDQQTLAQNIGLRDQLEPQIAKLSTKVNPRYHAPELPLVSTQSADGKELPLVVLHLVPGASGTPVTDLS